jgi:hypothetical protein
MQPSELSPSADGTVVIAGKVYLPNAVGGFDPIEMVKPARKLEDEMVRKVLGHARDLSSQIGRFKGHVYDDLSGLDALLAQEYQVKRGGRKGNRTYTSNDGLGKVQVQMADLIEFGPELQAAKALIDECLVEWTDEGRAEVRAIVLRAFKVEREGQINKAELFGLLRLDITDPRWLRAMQAIHDAIRVIGSKQYFRFYERADVQGRWKAITIDLAQVS